ncbi:hypothetical protein [uncultured Faecalibaculum sp.]|nr:hypothetical protein [uncultured Faecalibaculum sp.]
MEKAVFLLLFLKNNQSFYCIFRKWERMPIFGWSGGPTLCHPATKPPSA